jgi:hypothetical protein
MGGAGLRRAYSVVLWLSCAYYYASIPLLALLTVALGGGLLYLFFAARHVPVKIALVVLVLTLVTLWSILKSLFARWSDEDPGLRLDLRGHPRLRALLDDVASRVGTDVAVMERGGLALAVRRSLVTMARTLAENGAAAWYNPVWLFLNGFYRVFLRVSQGASRLQEVLADRWAAMTYGSKAFEEGLRHVIERSIRFDAVAGRALAEVARRHAVANLYAPSASSQEADPEVEQAIKAALMRKPSPYDSHPSPSERTRWVRALNAKGTAATPADAEPAWSLFADPERLQREMTEAVVRMVTASGATA